MKVKFSLLYAAMLPLFATNAVAEQSNLEVIEVTGDFKKESIQTLSASASVLGELEITQRGASYLDEILNSTANVNFTAGASRGRYVQIRGVGLRSQFQDPIQPSVGLLIDGINYSGLGGSALLFDVEQVAVYRGPQGTRYGADAMAGMIDMQTTAPSQDKALKVKLGVGNHNSYEAGIAAGTGLTDSSAIRVSAFQRKSDGYTGNLYLNRPTQEQDEQALRLKLSNEWSDNFNTSLALHHINIENGYDAFTLDNSRNSVADEPGQDNLESDAFSLTANYTGFETVNITATATGLQADSLYSYDEDWVCNNASQANLCAAGLHPWGYSSTDSYARDTEKGTFDLQISSKQDDWVVGLYSERRDVDLNRVYKYLNQPFYSSFDISNTAVYGQKFTAIAKDVELITGLRAESYEADYKDNNGFAETTDKTMLGGKVALEYQVVPRTMIYTSLFRGYKIGGVNGEALAKAKDKNLNIQPENYTFDPEYLWNAEFGVKGQSEDKSHTLRVTAFFMKRDDMQLKQWQVQDQQFAGYLDNASSGKNYGFEVEGTKQYTERLALNYSFGYLRSKIKGFTTSDGIDQHGRAQAQAPKYQYAFSFNYALTDNLEAQLGFEGKDSYYFSDSHNDQAPNQNLINASVSYHRDNWSLTAWGRNLADRDVPVRGFEFGNNPLKEYATENYYQYGEPRLVGLTFKYEL
jgi:outer membrane receptor protein involved in Fe transport